MGVIYEIASTPFVYVEKSAARLKAAPQRPLRVSFGPDPNQTLVVYEPARVTHDSCIIYFHGGGYLVGTPQSMGLAATVFNAWGYRFISAGFRLISAKRFPAQVDDAFAGTRAAMAYLHEQGLPSDSLIVGGSSAGGHAAAMVVYGRALQRQCDLDGSRIKGFVGMAPILDIDDLFIHPMPGPASALRCLDLPTVDVRNRQAVHDALLPYSPLHLIDAASEVPSLTLHGYLDRLSPYATDVAFVNKLNDLTGKDLAQLHTLHSGRYQHIKLTAGIFAEDPEKSEGLGALHTWLDAHAR